MRAGLACGAESEQFVGGVEAWCFFPGPDTACDVSRWPSWARLPAVPLEELGSREGTGGARAACGHGAISIRARERAAAAPGILLKAFSLFPVICSAPPGPGHVDNLFVEGKGAQSAGEREMSLFTQPLSAARAPPGAA